MIVNPMEVRALTFELAHSPWTLAAIGVLFESGLVDQLREPRTLDELAAATPSLSRSRIERCLDVAAIVGLVGAEGGRHQLAEGARPFLQQPMRGALVGDIRTHLMQPLALLDSASGPAAASGWRHTSPVLLQAQGDTSAGFAPMFKMNLVGTMGDLAARLEKPGARFLDVGVGVASLAISMCRAFPQLGVVGLDPYDVALDIGRENVKSAGLADRIELRRLVVEDLRDTEAFDLAWLPTFFIPAASLRAGIARVHASLRPGGWIIFPIGSSAGDARQRATLALLTESWGGPVLSVAEGEAALKEAGFSGVRPLPGPPFAPATLVAQR
jgi:hypothetical protein